MRKANRLSRWWISLLLVSATGLTPVCAADYGGRIVHPPRPDKRLAESIADAVRVLGLMTGRSFTNEVGDADASEGIVLVRLPASELPEAVRHSVEAYHIRSATTNRLLIAAASDLGLGHGLYRYLHELGARWYQPGDDFEIIPRRERIVWEGEIAEAPAFRSRSYFTSGAFGVATPVDPKIRTAADDAAYKRRNRFGGDITIGGHDWENLVRRHRQVFEEHPEYLALFRGQRQPIERPGGKFNYGIKLCVSNPAVIELYARDRIEQFRQRPHWTMLSVEPSDGGGFCECDGCRAIGDGSVSDQVFYLVNEVARRVAREFPDKMLSVLAYHLHAAPPSFAIEPNVYVQVVPGAFQQTRYAPVELVRAWARKLGGRNLGCYDYWVLPDGNRDLPTFDFVRRPADQIRTWKEVGCDSFMLETTFSAGALGPALYLAGQLGWQTGFDTTAALDEYYRLSFGPAAAPMRELLELWAQSFDLTPHVLGHSFRLLQQAWDLAAEASPAQRRRVQNYGNYLQYIRWYYEYRRLPKGNAERSRLARETIKLLWRMHDSRMVHTFRTQWMIRLHDERDRDWITDFDMRDHSGSGWAEVLAERPVRPEETAQWIAEGVRAYGDRALAVRAFSPVRVPLQPDARPQYPPLRFETYGYTRFQIYVPPGLTTVVVGAANELPDDHPKGPVRMQWVTGTGRDETVVRDETLTAAWREFVLPVAKSGLHELRFLSMSRAPFQVQLPALPLAATRFTPRHTESVDVYFVVPQGVPRVIFKTGSPPGATNRMGLFDGQGRPVAFEYEQVGNDHFYFAPVPADGAGIWSLRGYRNGGLLQWLTVPPTAGFAPSGLLVPSDSVNFTGDQAGQSSK